MLLWTHRPIDAPAVLHTTAREPRPIRRPLHLQTTVLPGGKIVIVDQDLGDGETVDILAEAPGRRLFGTAQDVTDYVGSERGSWEP